MTTIKFKKWRTYMDCKTGILNLSYDITFQDVSIIKTRRFISEIYLSAMHGFAAEWNGMFP